MKITKEKIEMQREDAIQELMTHFGPFVHAGNTRGAAEEALRLMDGATKMALGFPTEPREARKAKSSGLPADRTERAFKRV